MWAVYYELTAGNIARKKDFKEAVEKLTMDIPVSAKVVGHGRCFGPNSGIVIHLGNTKCNCPMDFSYVSTPFLEFMGENKK